MKRFEVKNLKDSRRAFLEWVILWLSCTTAFSWLNGGPDEVRVWLEGLALNLLTWVGMTALLFVLVALAAIMGSPFKRGWWFKND